MKRQKGKMACVVAALLLSLPLFAQRHVDSRSLKAKTTPIKKLTESNEANIRRICPGLVVPVQNRKGRLTQLGDVPCLYTHGVKRAGKAGAGSVASLPDGTQLWGHVINSNEWEQYKEEYGVYSFDTSDLSRSPLINKWDCWFSSLNANGGSVCYDGVFHFIYYNAMWYGPEIYYNEISTDTWQQQGQEDRQGPNDWSLIAMASAYDPTTGKVFAFTPTADGTASQITTINYAALSSTAIAPTDSVYLAMACNKRGELYAISENGCLSLIDKTTGAASFIGHTGVAPARNLQSAAFDNVTGKMYWASMEGAEGNYSSALYEVDVTTGQAAKMMDFPNGEELVSLVVVPAPSPLQPAMAQDVQTRFATGACVGKVTFSVPSLNYGGTELEGDVNYTVKANGAVMARGVAVAGEHVETGDIILAPGENKITVLLDNEYGQSEPVNIDVWIGYDNKPAAAQNMRYEIMEDNKVRISWDAVTTGVHGAPIKQDSIIYVVNRYPGNVQISDSLRTNCIIDEISPDTLKKYEYTVYSAIGYFYSAPACVTFYHGKPFNTPYVETFDSDGLFDNYDGYDTYTVVDANRDGCTFACSNAFFGNGYVTYKPNKDNGADDWLISPPINLKTGRVYSLLLDARSGRTEYPDQLEVLLGTDTVPANFVKTIMQPKIFNQPSRMMERRHFTVDADGEYRIGIHDITEAGLLHGSEIDKVMVVEEAQFAAPGSVTDLVARAGAKGALTAEISFVTPAKTAEGDVLTYIDSVQVMRDGSVIGVIYNPAVGSAQSFTDKDAIEGNNVYSVRAFNQSGPGLVSDCYVVAGNDCPMAPLDGKIADNLDGSCTITWQPSPTVGVNGGYVSPEDLSYNVIRRDVYYDDYATLIIHDELLEELIKERKAVAQVPVSENGEQRAFRNFFIEAVNDKLPDMASEKALTGYIVIGDSYQLPFHDGFSAKSDFCPLWVAESDNGYNWFVANMLSSDADGQCVAFSAVNPGDDATLSTGKIDLGNAANPMLVFRYYALPGVKATLDVHVSKNNVRNGEEDAVWQLDFSNDGNKEGWVPVAIDLNRFKGNGYINITFHATINDTNWPVVIDDVNVRDVHGTDMRAAMCVIPEHITAGSEFNVVASLENYGTEVPAGYTVNLYANGNKVASR